MVVSATTITATAGLDTIYMADYKHTLNLPKTDFPMKANLAQREPQRLQHVEVLLLIS